MLNEIDLSTEALLARRAIAEKAIPGAFNGENDYYVREQRAGMEHNCANPPKVVMADIDEILRLRNELADTECRVVEGDTYVNMLGFECENLKAQVEGLKLEMMRLEREMDWLAAHCASYVDKADVAKWRRAARKAAEEKVPMSDILQPCPSCGSPRLKTAERRHRSGQRHTFVICPKCGLRGPWRKTWMEAKAAWNDLPRALRWTKGPPTKPG